ncbi:MAG TPA: diacylglycerol kinase family protein [Polyangiaceae bacterium]|nr:diacylglycerol kinase family protein [Polyangiaceae bacterium]
MSRNSTNGESWSSPSAAPGPDSPGRIAVVVNGKAKNVTAEVISTLDQILLGGDLFVSRSLREADEIAQVLVSRGYGTVLTGGGDGTFSVMVTKVYAEAERQGAPLPRFGFLKLGTGNALAHVVGASGSGGGDLAADIRRLRQDAGSREIGLVQVDGALAPFCGFGVDAVVLQDYEAVKRVLGRTPFARLGRGPAGYTVSSLTRSLPKYIAHRPAHCRVINRGMPCYRVGPSGIAWHDPIGPDELVFEGPARLVAVATIPYYGYGFRAFPYAEERPDRMHLRIANLSATSFVRHFPSIWRGEYHNPKQISDYLVQSVDLQMDPPSPFQIGGDFHCEASEMHVELAARRIRLVDFYAPPSGAVPSERPPPPPPVLERASDPAPALGAAPASKPRSR